MFRLRNISIPIWSASSLWINRKTRIGIDPFRPGSNNIDEFDRRFSDPIDRSYLSLIPLPPPPLRVLTTMSMSGRFADRRTTKGVRDYSDGGGGDLLESISRATREIAGSPIHAAQTLSRASPRYSEGRPSDGHEITLPPRENADDVYGSRGR